MRVPYGWLREYVEIPWAPGELAERLTMLGVKVKAVHDQSLDIDGVVAGRILKVTSHDRSGTRQVVTVDVGENSLEVVCGAPNVRVGQWAAMARPGARLPGGRIIEPESIKGIVSWGMLLSATELLYGEPPVAGEGILVLDGNLHPGQPVAAALGLDDMVLELELTPNYGHCLSLAGVAQEIAALTGGTVRQPGPLGCPVALAESQWPLPITIASPELCHRYVGKVVGGVRVEPSPLWLQRRLQLAGMRPINNVVDVTNYVMLELGQPLHAFDYHRLSGPAIVVRPGQAGEAITTLDGLSRVLDEGMLVIADRNGAVAVAGVLGGARTEVATSTREVLLESAHFDPVSVRKTAWTLGIRSEASSRFERGVDPTGQAFAAERAAQLLERVAGASVQPGVVDRWPVPFTPAVIRLRAGRSQSLLGVALSESQVAELLRRFGFVVEERGEAMAVTVPARRPDVQGEVDLVEEVGRLHGYEHILPTLPRGTTPGGRTRRELRKEAVRALLLSSGVDEVVTSSLTSPLDGEGMRLDPADARRRLVRLANPLSEEESVLRSTLVATVLKPLSYNWRRAAPAARLFELGRVFQSQGEGQLPQEPARLAVAAYGPARAAHWGTRPPPCDFYYARGLAEAVAARLGLPEPEARPGRESWLHPGRQAVLSIGDRSVGVCGELHPEVAVRFDVPVGTVALELDLDVLLDLEAPEACHRPLPRYPAATRDLAVVVRETVPASQVLDAIRQAGGECLESARLFDVYRGEQVPAGYLSLAWKLTYRSPTGTLTDAEIETHHESIRRALQARVDATFR
jgi:phenylalanyl-tRNA synthetase beta chain